MNTSKKSNYPVMIDNDEIFETDKEKASLFNRTYLESSNIEDDGDEIPQETEVGGPEHEDLDKIIVTEKDVDDVLKCINVNKAYGPDNVSPRLIKEAGTSDLNEKI